MFISSSSLPAYNHLIYPRRLTFPCPKFSHKTWYHIWNWRPDTSFWEFIAYSNSVCTKSNCPFKPVLTPLLCHCNYSVPSFILALGTLISSQIHLYSAITSYSSFPLPHKWVFCLFCFFFPSTWPPTEFRSMLSFHLKWLLNEIPHLPFLPSLIQVILLLNCGCVSSVYLLHWL